MEAIKKGFFSCVAKGKLNRENGHNKADRQNQTGIKREMTNPEKRKLSSKDKRKGSTEK